MLNEDVPLCIFSLGKHYLGIILWSAHPTPRFLPKVATSLLKMGNICLGGGCCKPDTNPRSHRGKPLEKPFTDPSPVYPTQHSGYHMSLAKMDSAPSSSVVGIHAIHTGNLHIHANSEASLLKMSDLPVPSRKSFVSRIPPLGRSGSNESKHGSLGKISSLFEKYREKDPNNSEDAILTLGVEALCKDLELRPDEFRVLVLAWKCNAEQMCRFTRAEFTDGCRNLKVDSIRAMQLRLPEVVLEVNSRPDLFKDLYRFTFRFGLASVAASERCSGSDKAVCLKTLPTDMSILLWQLVFSEREPLLLDRWIRFLQSHPGIRGIQRDTWNMFLNFCETVGDDLSTYDDNEAWPSLFDDFVEYENDRTNQNYESNKPCKT